MVATKPVNIKMYESKICFQEYVLNIYRPHQFYSLPLSHLITINIGVSKIVFALMNILATKFVCVGI